MPQLPSSNRPELIQEFVTGASIDALNDELNNRGISADRVVTIHYVAGHPYANGRPHQYRVFYRVV